MSRLPFVARPSRSETCTMWPRTAGKDFVVDVGVLQAGHRALLVRFGWSDPPGVRIFGHDRKLTDGLRSNLLPRNKESL